MTSSIRFFLSAFVCCLAAAVSGQGTGAGKVDLTFNTQPTPFSGPNASVTAIVPLTNGQVIVGGGFSFFTPGPSGPLVKRNADGSPDASFDPQLRIRIGTVLGTAGLAIYQVLPRPDGRLYIHGNFEAVQGVGGLTNLAVLGADGLLDTNFVPTGLATSLAGARMAVEPDNKLLVNLYSNLVLRVGLDGVVETAMNAPGLVSISHVAVHTNGRIFLAGSVTLFPPNAAVVGLNSDGSPIPGFTSPIFTNTIPFGAVYFNALALQPDGKLLISGGFTHVNGVQRVGIVRLNTDGTLDTTFVPGPGGIGTTVPGGLVELDNIVVQPDGRILLGRDGPFRYSGVFKTGVARLSSTGALDTGFDPGSGPVDSFGSQWFGIRTVAIGPNGEVYAGGTFTNFNSTGRKFIVRLNMGAASAKPTIVSPPESQSVSNGVDVIFSVMATGPGPLAYSWKHNGKTIPGATNPSLTVSNVQLANVGAYIVTVANSAGAATAAPAILTVNGVSVPDLSGPAFKVTSPAGTFVRAISNSFTFSGTAKDNLGLAALCYQQDTNPWTQIALATNWNFTVSLNPGTNRFQVKITDIAGNNSATQKVTVFYVVTQALALKIVGNGMVAGATNGQGLEIGRNYKLTATPKPGNLFSNWNVTSDLGSLMITSPAVSFFMWSNSTVCANFVTNPFIALKGAYNGLFYPMSVPPSHDNSGFLTLTLTTAGAFSGKLLLAGAMHPLSGKFDLGLHATKTIARGTNTLLLVDLQLMSGSDEITGTVSNAAWVSDISGNRATFSTANPATNYAGKYTLLMSGSSNTVQSPFGQGFAALTVNNAGNVAIKGTLADNTAGMQTVPLAANGQAPFYANLYGGKGSIFGWLTFTNTPTNCIDGLLLWTKKSGVTGPFYSGGFSNEVTTLGSRYMTPAVGTAVLTFSNAIVRLEGGNLSSPLTNDVFLSALNKISVISTNTNKLVLTLTLPTGLLNGSFLNPDTKKISPIKGVVLQKQNSAAGFFLGTNESGAIYFGLPENFPLLLPVP